MFMCAVVVVLISKFIFGSGKQILLLSITFHNYVNYLQGCCLWYHSIEVKGVLSFECQYFLNLFQQLVILSLCLKTGFLYRH
jgi:hypothetical protein